MNPSWKSVRLSSILLCAMSTALTILICAENGPTWSGIVFAVITGMFLSASLYIQMLIEMQARIQSVTEGLRAMTELNAHLIADKVKVTIEEHDGVDKLVVRAGQSIH